MEKTKQVIILMDMDGTITPHRQPIKENMKEKLKYILNQKDIKIGIVSGSGYEYIQSQIGNEILENRNTYVFPCQGNEKWYLGKLEYKKSMIDEIGVEINKKLSNVLFDIQLSMRIDHDIKSNGEWIQERGSMINYCPIGRNSLIEDREKFINLDSTKQIRKQIIDRLSEEDILDDYLTYKLGGQTSIDIFPKGWDKSFVVKQFSDEYTVYFIGDRCFENGNDYEAFILAGDKGFSTDGPETTIKILDSIINKETKKMSKKEKKEKKQKEVLPVEEECSEEIEETVGIFQSEVDLKVGLLKMAQDILNHQEAASWEIDKRGTPPITTERIVAEANKLLKFIVGT